MLMYKHVPVCTEIHKKCIFIVSYAYMYRIISNMYDHESLVGKEFPIYGEVIRYDAFCDL